jgi:Bacterial aa3 type cytochrome c oxidase subunit IV
MQACARVTARGESAMGRGKGRSSQGDDMAGQHHHGEHKPGSMDIRTQEKTFAGFVRMVTWGIGISIGLLIFAALVNA